MNLIRTYIAAEVLKGVGLALSVLIAVVVFIEFVGELDDVGTASYGVAEAVTLVALRIPLTIFDTLPAAALLGALFGLGNLAVHRELLVMRASGVSVVGLLVPVAMAGVALMMVMVLLGESLAPSLWQYARGMRARALIEDVDLADNESAWIKDGDLIINLRRPVGETGFTGGVYLFELGERGLERVARAVPRTIDSSNQWTLVDYRETQFSPEGVDVRYEAEVSEEYNVSPELLGLSVVAEDLLDTPALQRYIQYLRDNDLDADDYLIAFWSRIANVVSVLLMTVLALPFVFGGLRSAGTGARLLVGLIVGLAYYSAGQVLASGGAVFDLDPRVVAWAPSFVLAVFTAVALARVR